MKDLMDMSLQADENMYPDDVEYRIKLFFGLFVQRKERLAAAATRNQRDVGRNLLNSPPQVGNIVTRATYNEQLSEEHPLVVQRQESLPPQPQQQAPAPGQPAATTRNQRDVEYNPPQVGNDEDEEQSEAARLCYITENYSEDRIINHPLVQSFIFLKWSKLRAFYIANITCVILFTLFLNVFILKNNETGSCDDANCKILLVLTTIFWASIVVRELLQISTAFGKYISNKKNILDVALIASTLCSVFIPWNIEDVRLGFSVVTVMLSWLELFVVSGRMPVLSEYMETLKTAIKNFIFFLIWYSSLLLSFTLCFYLLLRDTKSFSNVGLTFLNIFTMMIGEINMENIKFEEAPFLIYPLFVTFIILVAIVLLNLLNGLTSEGTRVIREAASLVSIRYSVRLIKDIEYTLMNICKRRIPLVSKVLSVDKIMVFSVHGTADYDYGYIYPNRTSSHNILIGDLELKHSMDESVLSETMEIIGQKSVATADAGKATAQTAIQKIQELLQEMQANASRNTSDA